MQVDQTQTEQLAVPASVEQVEPTTTTTTTESPAQEVVPQEPTKEAEQAEPVKEEQEAPKQEEAEPVTNTEEPAKQETEPVKEEQEAAKQEEEAPKQEEQPVEEAKEECAAEEPAVDEKVKRYSQVIKEALGLFEELRPVDKWEFYGEANGLKTYTRLDVASGLKMARGDGVIMKSVDDIVKPVLDTEAVKKWGANLQSHQIVEENSEYTIYRSIDVKRMFVTQRETVIATKIVKLEDGSTVTVQRSTEHPDYPEIKDYVRASVLLFAWHLTPDKEVANKTYVTSIVFVDPKGWVPIPVFNAFIHDQAQNVKKLKDYVEKL